MVSGEPEQMAAAALKSASGGRALVKGLLMNPGKRSMRGLNQPEESTAMLKAEPHNA